MKQLLVLISGIGLLAAAQTAAADVDLVATETTIGAIAKAVGGDHVDVDSLAPGPSDPHFLPAKPSMIRRVHNADLLVITGAELEIGWLPVILQSARNGEILPGNPGFLDLSMAVPLLDVRPGVVDRSMGDIHPLGNPHYALDPNNGIRMAGWIAARLAELDPDNANAYNDNLAKFDSEIAAKMKEWRAQLAPLHGTPIIQYHRSFNYLANAFGLVIVGEVEPLPGIPPTASHLRGLIAKIKTQHVPLLVMEPFYERRSARYLNEQTGIHIAVLPHAVGAEDGIDSYVDLFDRIVAVLTEAGGR